MVSSVSLSSAKYAASPMRFEAGTPAIEAAVGLGAAVDYIKHVGLRNLRDHEQKLTALALRETRKIPGIEIYGPAKASERTGVIAFNIARIHAHDLASLLDTRGICVRAGNHCAMPLHADILKIPASVRMSFAAYTTEEDIKNAVLALNEISRAID